MSRLRFDDLVAPGVTFNLFCCVECIDFSAKMSHSEWVHDLVIFVGAFEISRCDEAFV